jgi:hypothetical protein
MAGRSRQVFQNKQLPAQHAYTIALSDTVDCETTRGLLLATAGDVKVTMADGDVIILPNLTAGTVHPISVSRVWATGTVPANIIGLV